MKFLLKMLGVLLLLLIAAIVAVVLLVDSMVRVSVEKSGTFALGVPTTLEEADIGLFSGRTALGGLAVDNPDGFEKEHFLEIGAVICEVSMESFASDIVTLPLVEVSDLTLDLERNSSGTNYGALLDNLERLLEDEGSAGGEPGGEAGEETTSGKSFRIDRISLRNISVTVNLLPAGGDITRQTLTIPEIELTDVGGDDGASTVELATTLITALLETTLEHGGGLGVDDLLQDISGRLDPYEQSGAKVIEDLEGSAREKVEEATEGLEKKLGDIFGGDKSD
jgi:uncharacterized protein involved in outer membrane biogenesis